jgi:hypothetical protein
LFAGKPGAGKTTIAKILVENIDCDYLYINATDERSMDVMRDKVGSFAAAGSFKPLKIVILDEATHILQASQVVLLNMMERLKQARDGKDSAPNGRSRAGEGSARLDPPRAWPQGRSRGGNGKRRACRSLVPVGVGMPDALVGG